MASAIENIIGPTVPEDHSYRLKGFSGIRNSCEKAAGMIPAGLLYAFTLFILTRLALSAVGILSRKDIWKTGACEHGWLDVWNVWDTVWYVGIARDGYSTALNEAGMANYAFFPLYPITMKLVSFITGDPYLAGLAVSNICIFISCYYIFRLVRLDSDEDTALRSIKYLFLFPTAFILSGVFTESLFLALSLACFYHAKKGNWPAAGTLGFLTALTRPYGVVIMLPLMIEYARSTGFDPKKIRADALCLLLVPAGISLFAVYNYYLTGDFLAFSHIQSSWGHRLANPIVELTNRLQYGSADIRFGGFFTLTAIVLLLAFFRKIDISYLIFGLLLILIPLSTPSSAWSMTRYTLAAFPLFIIMAKLGKNRLIDQSATAFLAMMQGFLMSVWTNWSTFVI